MKVPQINAKAARNFALSTSLVSSLAVLSACNMSSHRCCNNDCDSFEKQKTENVQKSEPQNDYSRIGIWCKIAGLVLSPVIFGYGAGKIQSIFDKDMM